MNRKRWKSSTPSPTGLTLIEALAGMAILGGVLAATVVARSKLVAQAARSRQVIEAAKIADILMEEWWMNRHTFPRESSGDVPGHEGWTWRTRSVVNRQAKELAVEVIALEVFAPSVEEATASNPSCRLEFVLPERLYDASGPDDY